MLVANTRGCWRSWSLRRIRRRPWAPHRRPVRRVPTRPSLLNWHKAERTGALAPALDPGEPGRPGARRFLRASLAAVGSHSRTASRGSIVAERRLDIGAWGGLFGTASFAAAGRAARFDAGEEFVTFFLGSPHVGPKTLHPLSGAGPGRPAGPAGPAGPPRRPTGTFWKAGSAPRAPNLAQGAIRGGLPYFNRIGICLVAWRAFQRPCVASWRV